MTNKPWKKLKHLKNEKELLRWNKKHFPSFLKGLSIKQITQFFLEGESPTFNLRILFEYFKI